MRTLRFHQALYSAKALEEAVSVFAEHATIEQRQQMPYYEIDVTATEEADEGELAGELMNYVLALTVEEKRAT